MQQKAQRLPCRRRSRPREKSTNRHRAATAPRARAITSAAHRVWVSTTDAYRAVKRARRRLASRSRKATAAELSKRNLRYPLILQLQHQCEVIVASSQGSPKPASAFVRNDSIRRARDHRREDLEVLSDRLTVVHAGSHGPRRHHAATPSCRAFRDHPVARKQRQRLSPGRGEDLARRRTSTVRVTRSSPIAELDERPGPTSPLN